MGLTVRRIVRVLAGVAVLAGIGMGARQASLGPEVDVVAVARRELVQRVVTSGRVLPEARVQVGALVSGRVSAVSVRQGDRVAKGDVLAQLDDAEARAQVDDKKAAVTQAEARAAQVRHTTRRLAQESARLAGVDAAQAERRLERARKLLDVGAGSRSDFLEATDALQLALSRKRSAAVQVDGTGDDAPELMVVAAQVEQARAQLALAEARLREMTLLAPDNGVVLSRAIEPGDVVQPGKPLFVVAIDGERLIVTQPEERQLGVLKVGLRGLASADAFADKTMAVEIVSIAPAVDPLRGTVEVKLRASDPPAELRPDMTLSVDVEVSRRAGVLVVPVEMLRDASAPEPWVLVVEQGRTVQRKVQLGARGEGAIEVKAGLKAGELLLVPGAKRLQPGVKVRVRAQGQG